MYDMVRNNLYFFKRKVALTLAAIMIFSFVADVRQVGIQKINAAETKVTYGDVNSDGTINLLDMILLKSYLTENNTKGFSAEAADVDDDAEISSRDAVELLMYLLNEISSFSFEKNIDSDGDGLCDYIEKEILATDPKLSDTDGDGLDDYSEVYLCGTDPLKLDTGNTGKKDPLKDVDEDGLTNAEEIKLTTSPTVPDTDDDGLSDGEEVTKYKTNPLLPDTDNDFISDGEELKLGLDPTKINTDGIINDSERIFSQILSSDDEIIKSINSDSNYVLSVSAKAAGSINEAIDISISSHSNYLQNECIVGDIIDIDYLNELKLDQLTVSFEIPDANKIENYCIFKYFEEINMLLPVETLYNEKKAYINDTKDGTYCIVDMNQWLIRSSENDFYVNTNNVGASFGEANSKKDIYFVLFTTIDNYAETRSIITEASKTILTNGHKNGNDDIRIYYITFSGHTVSLKNSNQYYIDYQAMIENEGIIEDALSKTGKLYNSIDKQINEKYSLINALVEINGNIPNSPTVEITNDNPYIQDIITEINNNTAVSKDFDYNNVDEPIDSVEELITCEQNQGRDKYCIVIDNNFKPVIRYGNNTFETVEKLVNTFKEQYNVNFSFICDDDNVNLQNYDRLSSNSQHYSCESDYSKMIIDKIAHNNSSEFIITYNYDTGLFKKVVINGKITPDWLKASNGLLTEKEIKELGLPDSDGDGKYDFEEINMSYIKFDENGEIILPTLKELYSNTLRDCYTEEISDKNLNYMTSYIKTLFKNSGIEDIDLIWNSYVIVLNSDPSVADGDGDGIPDIEDEEPSNENYITIDDKLIDDSNIFEESYKTTSNYSVKANGIVNSISGEKKNNNICYTRSINGNKKIVSRYIIEPDQNSDYQITINTEKNNSYDINIYNKTGIIFKRKNMVDVQCVEQDGKVIENKKSCILEKGKKYYVDITINPVNPVNNTYDVVFEQDNWVYAPNGGYDCTKINYYMQTETTYTDDDDLFSMLKEAVEILKGPDEMRFENIDKYLEKKSDEQILYASNKNAETLIDMHKKNTMDLDSIVGDLGNTASLVGFGSGNILYLMQGSGSAVILALLNRLGSGATVVGGFTALYAIIAANSKTSSQSLGYALYEGRYNLATHITQSTYSDIDKNFSTTVTTYNGWNDFHYINKYNADNSRKTIVLSYNEKSHILVV